MPKPDKNNQFLIRSDYDGHMRRYSFEEIMMLIAKLKPTFVVLPEGICQQDQFSWKSLPSTIFPFFPLVDSPGPNETSPYGWYCTSRPGIASQQYFVRQVDGMLEISEGLRCSQQALFFDKPCYVAGDFSPSLLNHLQQSNISYVESNRPADDAYRGIAYQKAGVLKITEEQYQMQFETLEFDCGCSTCNQKLSKAYLNYLFQSTPLLCQRLLIQHNIWMVSNGTNR
jgi:queuine tRNA-ribosyltransferase